MKSLEKAQRTANIRFLFLLLLICGITYLPSTLLLLFTAIWRALSFFCLCPIVSYLNAAFFFVSSFLHLIAFLLEDVPCFFFFETVLFFFLLVFVGALRVPLSQLYTSTARLCNGNRLHADISIWIMVIPYNFHWASVVWSRTFLPTSIQLLSPDPRVNEESKKNTKEEVHFFFSHLRGTLYKEALVPLFFFSWRTQSGVLPLFSRWTTLMQCFLYCCFSIYLLYLSFILLVLFFFWQS